MALDDLDDYWTAHLVDEGLCAICCNRGTFTSQVSGREMFCLCPNGRTLLTEADQTEATNA